MDILKMEEHAKFDQPRYLDCADRELTASK